jgi:ABC-type lipoprotein release transport system permease subunit
MTFGDMLGTSLENLGRRKVRTALTSIGVVVGILTIVTMVSLGIGVRAEINKQFGAIGLERVFVTPDEGEQNFFTQFSRPARNNPITPADVEAWRALANVESVQPDIELPFGTAVGLRIGEETLSVGISGAEDGIRAPFQQPPAALAGTIEVQETGNGVVLTQEVLEDFNIDATQYAGLVGQPAELIMQSPRGEQQSFAFTVQGVSSEESPFVRVPLEGRIAMKSWWFNKPNLIETEGYDQVTLRAATINDARTLVDSIRGQGFEVQSLETILDLANQVFTVINVMLSSVGGLALLVASLGIVNTMIMSIYERTREIGTLKAIGASRGDIRRLFMLEAGMIGLLGGLVGLVSGWALGLVLNRAILWYIEREQLPVRGDFFVVTPPLALAAVGFAILVGIVAGLYPANRAAKLDPLTALRHE